MLRAFLCWVDRFFALPVMPAAASVDESQARIARLTGMYADFGRLTYAEWLAKWLPNEPQAGPPRAILLADRLAAVYRVSYERAVAEMDELFVAGADESRRVVGGRAGRGGARRMDLPAVPHRILRAKDETEVKR